MKIRRLIGDRNFYRAVLRLLIPIVIQQFITNFVSLLDNVMVGRVGTLEMSAVSIVNQLLFIFYLCKNFTVHLMHKLTTNIKT